jgi:hypothetical protein
MLNDKNRKKIRKINDKNRKKNKKNRFSSMDAKASRYAASIRVQTGRSN